MDPLHRMKAEFFKTLGHPGRIRVLELLSEREQSVSELLTQVELGPSHLSQQLAVLRRAGLVSTRKRGALVIYSLDRPEVTDLMRSARQILTQMLNDQVAVLDTLKTRKNSAEQRDRTRSDAIAPPAVGPWPDLAQVGTRLKEQVLR